MRGCLPEQVKTVLSVSFWWTNSTRTLVKSAMLRVDAPASLLGFCLIRRRTSSVAAAASRRRFSLVFTALWLPAATDDTAASAHTEDTSVTQQDLNAPRHTHTHTAAAVSHVLKPNTDRTKSWNVRNENKKLKLLIFNIKSLTYFVTFMTLIRQN